MPTIDNRTLSHFTAEIFVAYGIPFEVANVVANSLVDSNLKGHDSHGVIRIIDYIDWLQKGWFDPNAKLEVIKDQGVVLMVDGHFQFGQLIGRESTRMAIEKAREHGVCLLTIRRSGHLGRIGEFMEMAAEAGLAAFALTNTHGGGVLVAPHGGREPRLSANPLGGGAPLAAGEGDMIMDIATSTIAEGKIKVARSKGIPLPPGCVVNGQGEPTTDPEQYFGNPPGSLLPMAGHKGYALSMFAEIFAGALSGAGCSKEGFDRVANGWFSIFVDPAAFCGSDFFKQEVGDLVKWVKSSKLMQGFDQILLPGEPESMTFRDRVLNGISIDQSTWEKIVNLAEKAGVSSKLKTGLDKKNSFI